MNEQYLKPLSSEKAREIGRMGGLSRSPNKSIGQRLHQLKKKGLTDEKARELYDLMTDAGLTDLDILLKIKSVMGQSDKLQDQREAIKLYQKWREDHHGTDLRLDNNVKSLNIEVNAHLTPDEIAEIVNGHRKDTVGD